MKHLAPREYTVPEEISHSAIHALGSHLGAAMLALMVVFGARSGEQVAWKVVSGAIFGATAILLYAISAVYHAVTHPRAKQILEVCDHMAIYFLIAGSYTPFTLVTLRPEHPVIGWTIFGIVWGLTVMGVVFKVFFTGKLRVVSTLAYVGMGWIVVFAIKPLMDALPTAGLVWLLAGGGLYTLGTVFYLWRLMPFHHAVWHLFVLAGTLCHFFAVLFYVMM
ncbi:MAG: hemolysin III family protein [Kiritimatiellia bacterium]|nr:hemolysin III family protein [Kiritimatiellia bacterium]